MNNQKPLQENIFSPKRSSDNKGLLSLKEIMKNIQLRPLKNYDFTPNGFYKLEMTQILNKKTSTYAQYREKLIEFDQTEFLKNFYHGQDQIPRLFLSIVMISNILKLYPNYIPLGPTIYLLMQKNMMKKQKLLNDNAKQLVEDFRKKQSKKLDQSQVAIFLDSGILDDSMDSVDDSINKNNFFQTLINKSDSIGSIENLVKYIKNIEKGYDEIGNGYLSSPKIKPKKYQKKRASTIMLDIIKKLTDFDNKENAEQKVKEFFGIENVHYSSSKVHSHHSDSQKSKGRNSKKRNSTKKRNISDVQRSRSNSKNKTVTFMERNKILSISDLSSFFLSKNKNHKFVRTSVFLERLKNTKKKLFDKNSFIKSLKAEHEKKKSMFTIGSSESSLKKGRIVLKSDLNDPESFKRRRELPKLKLPLNSITPKKTTSRSKSKTKFKINTEICKTSTNYSPEPTDQRRSEMLRGHLTSRFHYHQTSLNFVIPTISLTENNKSVKSRKKRIMICKL